MTQRSTRADWTSRRSRWHHSRPPMPRGGSPCWIGVCREMPPAKGASPCSRPQRLHPVLTSVLLEADLAAISARGRSTPPVEPVRIRKRRPRSPCRHRGSRSGTRCPRTASPILQQGGHRSRRVPRSSPAISPRPKAPCDRCWPTDQPAVRSRKFYARDQQSYTAPMKFSVFNMAPERAISSSPDTKDNPGCAPANCRSQSASPTPPSGNSRAWGSPQELRAAGAEVQPFPRPGVRTLPTRFAGNTVWVGPGPTNRWYIPDLDHVERGHRSEPVTVYSEMPRINCGDSESSTRPPTSRSTNLRLGCSRARPCEWTPPVCSDPGPAPDDSRICLRETNGQPGAVFRWLEVAGPFHESWPPPGHRLLFGDLPLRPVAHGSGVEVVSTNPAVDAPRPPRAFAAVYRRPEVTDEPRAFRSSNGPRIRFQLPGRDDRRIHPLSCVRPASSVLRRRRVTHRISPSTRLPFPLNPPRTWRPGGGGVWTSPDRRGAPRGSRTPARPALPAVCGGLPRLLAGPPPHRRHRARDATLYSDYYLDDLLTESALDETRAYFSELIHDNLPARSLVASDFVMVNERLAQHYGLPPFEGINIRRVSLP